MVDYSHLKVLILEQEFVEDEAAVQEWLAFLKEKSEVPRNAYVVVTEDAEALLAQSETLGEAVGDYLEEQFENVSQIKSRRTPRSDRCTRRWTTGRRHCFCRMLP